MYGSFSSSRGGANEHEQSSFLRCSRGIMQYKRVAQGLYCGDLKASRRNLDDNAIFTIVDEWRTIVGRQGRGTTFSSEFLDLSCRILG